MSETTNLNESFEEYWYDFLNQLTSVLDKRNNTYTSIYYDDGGNIEQVVKKNYDTLNNQPSTEIYRNTYTYGDNNWKDKLTTFNNQTITYDAMGNPLQYRDGLSFKWENGRQLHSVTKNNVELEMKYDSNGLRMQKGNVHYYYDSDNNLIAMVSGNSTLFFYYDESGNITSFSLGGNMYFYVKNLQGDIINIVDSNGAVLVRYDYDVFGKITAIKNGNNQAITDTSSIAFLNPLRYRGYVYDDETGLYYLQSRYYDPVTGRFLNADVYADTISCSPLSTNVFAYCENCYINKYDYDGKISAYCRDKALAYAKKYWNSHSSDFAYFEDGDCANFVSQCLYAGNLKQNSKWYHRIESRMIRIFLIPFCYKVPVYSYSWTVVSDQYNYLVKSGFVKYVIRITKNTTQAEIRRLRRKYNLRAGDVLYMDFEGNGSLDHAVMISKISGKGSIYYTGHTNPKWNELVPFSKHKKMVIKILVMY